MKPNIPLPVPDVFRPKPVTTEELPPLGKAEQIKIDKGLTRWIIASSEPFSVVDQPEFRNLMTLSHPTYKLCTRQTMKKRIFGDFDTFKKRAVEGLRGVPSRISITADSWTSAQQECYFVITAHWLSHDWEMKDAVLDFIQMPASHTGENLMKVTMDTLLDFQFAHKVLGITVDGAANRRTCFAFLAPALKGQRILKGCEDGMPEFRLRCIRHCLDLIADVGFEKRWTILEKLREQISYLKRPKAKLEFRQFASVANLKLPLDVRTRWNSRLYMMEGAYNSRQKLTAFIQIQRGAIADHALSDEEWLDVGVLIMLLKPFDNASKECSGSKYPTFHLGLQHLEELQDHLRAVCADVDQVAWVREIAQTMANKTTEIVKDNWDQDAVLLAATLGPYLKVAGIPVTKRERATDVLDAAFRRYRNGNNDISTAANAVMEEEDPDNVQDLRAQKIRAIVAPSGVKNEVDGYLQSPVVPNSKILHWWKAHATDYPTVSRIAKDVLAVNALSVASEREFSKAGNLITDTRNRLSGKAACASMCLKTWHKIYDYEVEPTSLSESTID